MRSWIVVAGVVALLGCTNHSDANHSDDERKPPPSRCFELPIELPTKAVIRYTRHDDTEYVDAEHRSWRLAYVVDADCPKGDAPLEAPRCVRLTPKLMQAMWTKLREFEVHRIETVDRDGICHHCGYRRITVTWPGGQCSAGYGFEDEISNATSERFYEATHYLDAVSIRVLELRPAADP